VFVFHLQQSAFYLLYNSVAGNVCLLLLLLLVVDSGNAQNSIKIEVQPDNKQQKEKN